MKTVVRNCLIGALVLTLATPARSDMLYPRTPESDRERIAATLAREDVRAELRARGVDIQHAEARVAALTDDEARVIAAQVDTLPAGGFIHAIAVGVGALLYAVAMGVVVVGALVVKVFQSLASGNASASDSENAPQQADDAARKGE